MRLLFPIELRPLSLDNPRMRDAVAPKISKWPFLAGDALLLWTAGFIYIQSKVPLGVLELSLAVACIATGALLAIIPFVLEYRAAVRLADTEVLTSVVAQIQNVQKIADQISGATGRWQNVADDAAKTAAAANSIAERMTAEVKAFTDFMQRVNDSEKTNLRLEVEKFRRGENDWLQVLVRLLDHIHALHTAAVRSGQPRLVEQISNFQNACRDAARRVGLAPFHAEPAESFDPQRHQCPDGDGKPQPTPDGARIADTIATGYTFQGRLLRHALVRLQEPAAPAFAPAAVASENQSQLPLSSPARPQHPSAPAP